MKKDGISPDRLKHGGGQPKGDKKMCKVLAVTTENGTKGIELYFESKPAAEVLERIKGAFFRWHRVKKCWYHKDSPEARKIAAELGDETASGAAAAEQNSATGTGRKAKTATSRKPKLAPLFERCDLASIPAHPTNLANKEIAAQVRAHLKERFPEVKFSLRCRDSGYTGAIDGEIIASPYGREHIMKDRYTGEPDRWGYMQNSAELDAVQKYFDAYLQSYNYDNSDYMTDYFDVGFYGNFSVASDYTQTEPTQEQAEQIAEFAEMKKADDERKAAEQQERFLQEQREREEAAKAYEARRAQELKDKDAINAHIKVEDLPEAEQIAVLDLLEGIGKEATLEELDARIDEKINERIQKGKDVADLYRDAIISRKVKFTNTELFGKFCRLFMDEWEFLKGKGGSNSEDVRVNSWGEYAKLNAEQRETVHTFAADCVGVYLNDVLQFVIDPQGYNYARYVMRPADGEAREESATEYRRRWKEASEQLPAFYLPAPIAEQVEAADLREGEEFTALVLDDFVEMVTTARGKIIKAQPCKYAQYSDAARIELLPKGKRKARYFYIHSGQSAAIYRGTLPDIPDRIKYTQTNSPNLREVNFAGMNAKEYMKNAIAWYAEQGYKPILDTVQR